jgi:hypothetical protein
LTRPIDPQSAEIQALRERVFQGKVNSPTLCAIFGRDPRTLSRWKARGLPYVTIGNEDWFDLDQVRSWIDAPKSRAGAPRPRGRPKSSCTLERRHEIARDLPPAKPTFERYRHNLDPPTALETGEPGARD